MKKMQTADNASFVSFLPYKAIAKQWLFNLLGLQFKILLILYKSILFFRERKGEG